jgi:hypothetical protein
LLDGAAVIRLAACALLLVGCRTRIAEERAAPPDLGPCIGHHHLVEVPLTELEALEPWDQAIGRALRVRVAFPVGGCDVPDRIDVMEAPRDGGDVFRLLAHVWVQDDPLHCPMPRTVERALLLVGSAKYDAATVSDAAQGGTLVVSAMVGGAPTYPCGHATPLGGACDHTCDCAGRAVCLPVATGGICAYSCSDDNDCTKASQLACTGELPFTCGAKDGCAADGDCPFGQRCGALPSGIRACHPAQTARADAPCRCDPDCGYGGVCNLTVDLAYCAVPCAGPLDCPPPPG